MSHLLPHHNQQSTSHQHNNAQLDETYHLFIQALSERNEEAWDEIQKQFNYLVKKWIRNQIFMITPAEIEDLAQITFFKFWNILSKQKGELTKNFPFCGAIVKYLKRCAETTAIEHLRKQQRLNHLDEKLKQSNQFAYELQSRQQFEGLSEQSNLVRRWVTTNINHPDERLLLKLLFEYDMKPREIVNKFPSKFPTKRDVYRLREKIVKRARRNKQLNSYYSS